MGAAVFSGTGVPVSWALFAARLGPAFVTLRGGCTMGKEEGSLVSLARVTINAPADKVSCGNLLGGICLSKEALGHHCPGKWHTRTCSGAMQVES